MHQLQRDNQELRKRIAALRGELGKQQRIIDQCGKIVGDVVPSTECLTVDLTTLVEAYEKLRREPQPVSYRSRC